MSCVYVLFSEKNGKRYVGSSRDNSPDGRLKSHNSGKTRSTKSGKPWKIIYSETCANYFEARKRELFLKSGQGRKYLDEIIG